MAELEGAWLLETALWSSNTLINTYLEDLKLKPRSLFTYREKTSEGNFWQIIMSKRCDFHIHLAAGLPSPRMNMPLLNSMPRMTELYISLIGYGGEICGLGQIMLLQ